MDHGSPLPGDSTLLIHSATEGLTMTAKSSDAHQRAIGRFWRNYLSILEKHSIPGRARPWYRKHVEMYISTHQDLHLAEHSPAMVEGYLNARGRLPGLEEWQFRQIADALRLMFCDLVHPHWAADYDWYKWRAFARDLKPYHPSLMRDANPINVVADRSNPSVKQFRNEYSQTQLAFVKTIRLRNIAVKTVKTYEQWICNFLQFHYWPEIKSLVNRDIRA